MSQGNEKPLYSSSDNLPELTLRAIVLSLILAALLAASNAYLALKLGQTISASIPASVLALAVLRFFKNSNVLESNIAQTAASAGEGVAAAISFVLPAMIVVHAWVGFPYWETTLITIFGGLMGVLFSIPLRRIMLNLPELGFPEGTAIGNLLKASANGGKYIKYLAQGGIGGGLFSLAQSGLQFMSDNVQLWAYTSRSLFGIGIGFSPALVAAGYIVGVQVGLSLFFGVVVGWLVIMPLLGMHYGVSAGDAYDAAMTLWSTHLRYVGVGTMLVGGVYTLFTLIKPIIVGFQHSFTAFRQHAKLSKPIPRTEHDLRGRWVIFGVVVCAIALFLITSWYISGLHIVNSAGTVNTIALCTLVYFLIVGFILATICGYFTGLVGSSNNPLSGLLIIAVMLISLIYLALFHGHMHNESAKVISVAILVAAVIACMTSIANENLQDLKAGHIIGATPWKQQLMLAIGVVVSALIIGPVLNLLFQAYGIAGVYPHAGMNPAQMLAAPQASLLAAVAQGVIMHSLPWGLIEIGGGIAITCIIIDKCIRRTGLRLPALAVGLGIYLPPEIISPVVIGALINHFVRKKLKQTETGDLHTNERYQRGILLACGLVAGSALMGVFLAIPFVIAGNSNVLAIVGPNFDKIADILGALSLVGICYWLYRTATSK